MDSKVLVGEEYMQKLKVLIEENTVGSVHPVEVVADAPIATLVPALVDALQLPHTDLFGKPLVYMLRSASGGQVYPEYGSLLDAGVAPGTRLALDSYVVDGSVAALERGPGWQSSLPPGALSHMNMYGSVTLPDPSGFVPGKGSRSNTASSFLPETGGRLNAITGFAPETGGRLNAIKKFVPEGDNNSATVAVPAIPSMSMGQTKKRRSSRREFLVATGAVLGLGGAGLAYAAYQRYTGGNGAPISQVHTKGRATVTHTTGVTVQKAPTKPLANGLPTTAKTILTFQGHKQIVRTIAWSPKNMQLASGSDDTNLLMWDTEGNIQRTLKHPASVQTLAWSAGGKHLVTGAGNQVTFFNAQTGMNLSQNQEHTQMVTHVAWARQGVQQVVSVGADQRAYVWNGQTYQLEITYAQHTIAILAAAWSADSQTVATGSQGGVVRVWTGANGQDMHGYFMDSTLPIHALAFAPTGTQLAVAGDDGVVRLWNGLACMNNGVRCTDVPQRIQVSKKAVRTLEWSPDGRMLAVGTDDGLLSLFAPGQAQPHLFTLQQKAAVNSVTWSADNKQLGVAVGNNVLLMMLM